MPKVGVGQARSLGGNPAHFAAAAGVEPTQPHETISVSR